MTILAASHKVLTIATELHRSDAITMSMQREDITSLQQIEDLHSSIFAPSDHKVARRVKVERVHAIVEDPVILNQLLCPQIVQLHTPIFLRDRNELWTLVPCNLITEALLILERVNQLCRFSVKNPQHTILSRRGDELVVWRESYASDPVGVSSVGGKRFTIRDSPHFHRLVIAGGDVAIGCVREVHGSDGFLMGDELTKNKK